LITGESGTGKELVANAIHQRSPRANGPFIKLHCAALAESLLESELFGHERGSFTGAVDKKEGKFELADGGTIFLDEISTMDERTQINLLRVLESFAYMRIGGKKERQANVRVVAATNRDLMKMTETSEFREDLYYRLNILQINLPPLRERREDVALLATEFMAQFAQHYRKPMQVVPADTQRLLEGYHWPGNVRELRNTLESMMVLAEGETLTERDMPERILEGSIAGAQAKELPTNLSMEELEKLAITKALEQCAGNRTHAAERLKISVRTLQRKLRQYELEKGLVIPNDVLTQA
jgi:transcriptional regulator with PAS, ATPase and Fis domain